MGVVMLGMLVLSRIIGGGMALARAELTGPSLSRLRPKLRQTAIALWGLYLVLTLIEMFALKFIGGMTFFDSINHAFTTMPSGGFSTRDASIAFYDSEVIEIIIIVFMFLAGVNFTLMWLVGAGNWRSALKDEEFRTYLFYIFSAVSIIVLSLVLVGVSAGQATIDTLFHVLSIGTSTGYASADYGAWPGVARIILFLLMIVGACAGSTSGGLKADADPDWREGGLQRTGTNRSTSENSHDSNEQRSCRRQAGQPRGWDAVHLGASLWFLMHRPGLDDARCVL
jgi:trk system potassium uptake protein TrkH